MVGLHARCGICVKPYSNGLDGGPTFPVRACVGALLLMVGVVVFGLPVLELTFFPAVQKLSRSSAKCFGLKSRAWYEVLPKMAS